MKTKIVLQVLFFLVEKIYPSIFPMISASNIKIV